MNISSSSRNVWIGQWLMATSWVTFSVSIVGSYLSLPSSCLSEPFSHRSAHNPQLRQDTIFPVASWFSLFTTILKSSTEIALWGQAFIQLRQSVHEDVLTIWCLFIDSFGQTSAHNLHSLQIPSSLSTFTWIAPIGQYSSHLPHRIHFSVSVPK